MWVYVHKMYVKIEINPPTQKKENFFFNVLKKVDIDLRQKKKTKEDKRKQKKRL